MVVADNTTTIESENSSVVEETQQKAVKVAEKTKPSETQSTEELLQNQPESDTMKKKTGTEIEENGDEQRENISENAERHSKTQVENSSEELQDRGTDGRYTEPTRRVDESGHRDVPQRTSKVETGKLDDVIDQENFSKLTTFVGNNIVKDKFKELRALYSADQRLIDGYEVDTLYSAHYEIESVNGRDISQIGISEEKEILYFFRNIRSKFKRQHYIFKGKGERKQCRN